MARKAYATPQVEKLLNRSFTGLGWLDQSICPHQLPVYDLFGVQTAIGDLRVLRPIGALTALAYVGRFWYQMNFSPEACQQINAQLNPSYKWICMGGLGHLMTPPDLTAEIGQILSGDGGRSRDSRTSGQGSSTNSTRPLTTSQRPRDRDSRD